MAPRKKHNKLQGLITPRVKFLASPVRKSMGLKDPAIERFPKPMRERIYHAINDAARIFQCHARDLMWNIDHNGIIKVKKKEVIKLNGTIQL